jgi:hypothetical protein
MLNLVVRRETARLLKVKKWLIFVEVFDLLPCSWVSSHLPSLPVEKVFGTDKPAVTCRCITLTTVM